MPVHHLKGENVLAGMEGKEVEGGIKEPSIRQWLYARHCVVPFPIVAFDQGPHIHNPGYGPCVLYRAPGQAIAITKCFVTKMVPPRLKAVPTWLRACSAGKWEFLVVEMLWF
jgi:hypothetical protein